MKTNCYFLALSLGTSADRETNTTTLFSLVETVQPSLRDGEALDAQIGLPYDVAAIWKVHPEEHETEFEAQLVVTPEEDEATDLVRSPILVISTVGFERVRLCVHGVRFPTAAGHYALRVDSRLLGEQNWQRQRAMWIVQVFPATQMAPPQEEPTSIVLKNLT